MPISVGVRACARRYPVCDRRRRVQIRQRLQGERFDCLGFIPTGSFFCHVVDATPLCRSACVSRRTLQQHSSHGLVSSWLVCAACPTQEKMGVTLKKRDEMISLITGLNFLLQFVSDECYFLETPQVRPCPCRLLVLCLPRHAVL